MSSNAEQLLNSFLDTVNETAELETERTLLPKDVECNASIVKYQLAAGTSISKETQEERAWCSVTFEYELDSQEVREVIGRDKAIGFGRPIYLNFLETGGFDPKNNQELGKMMRLAGIQPAQMTVREILDSFVGQYLRVRILHRTYKNKSDETVTSANIVVIGEAE